MHLSKLVKWDLIKSRRDGKMILYTIKDKRVFELFKLVGVDYDGKGRCQKHC